MNYEAYIKLFKELGFRNTELRKTLKHQSPVPSIYFNRKKDGDIYFTVHARDRSAFKDTLWQFIEAQQKKDQDTSLRTVVPVAGSERQAFLDVVGQKAASCSRPTSQRPSMSVQPPITPGGALPAAESAGHTSPGRRKIFDCAKAAVPAELLPLSGKVFYSGRDAFSRPAKVYMLGANPGGDPNSDAEGTIEADIDWVATQAPTDWSAYRDESWKGKPPGTHGMQPRVLHMFNSVGLEPGHVPASNLVFQRSRREAGLSKFEDLAHACIALHAGSQRHKYNMVHLRDVRQNPLHVIRLVLVRNASISVHKTNATMAPFRLELCFGFKCWMIYRQAGIHVANQ